jgi:hypothetical protein
MKPHPLFTRADWEALQAAPPGSVPCPECGCVDWYRAAGPRPDGAGGELRYRMCKMCGFWQRPTARVRRLGAGARSIGAVSRSLPANSGHANSMIHPLASGRDRPSSNTYARNTCCRTSTATVAPPVANGRRALRRSPTAKRVTEARL